MRFVVFRTRQVTPSQFQGPTVTLFGDNWDDFGFRTLFHAKLYIPSKGRSFELGRVKILQVTREGETIHTTELPEEFEIINTKKFKYCSLGQTVDYYRILSELPKKVALDYLNSINDCAYLPEIRDEFADFQGFDVSLLRFSEAAMALRHGAAIIDGRDVERGELDFTFRTKLEGADKEHVVPIDFRPGDDLPNNVFVVVGRNGTGKTQVLANLALALADTQRRDVGTFDGSPPPISRVVAVSYNAFDHFAVPGYAPDSDGFNGIEPGSNQAVFSEEDVREAFNYKYCGLRTSEGQIIDPLDLSIELDLALRSIKQKDRTEFLYQVLEDVIPIKKLDSFIRITKNRRNIFKKLSAGQRMVVSVVCSLVGFIEQETVVLFDEPENNLHPGLLSSLIGMLSKILEEFRSVAIVATHSPIVLQQVPSRCVRVFRRHENTPEVTELGIETFGESLETIFEKVLGLAEPESDYHDVLDALLERHTVEEIEQMFEGRLGSNAKAYLYAKAI